MRVFATLALVALVSAPIAAGAQDTPAPEQTAKPKKICRATEGQTGTRLPKRKICKTAEEWAQERDLTEDLDRLKSETR